MQDLNKFKNKMELSGKNVYVGNRYAPVLDDGGWDKTKEYEPLTIIQHEGDSYIARTWVPKGIDILNKDFWYSIGVYNAQIASYRKRVEEVETDLNTLKKDINTDNNNFQEYIDHLTSKSDITPEDFKHLNTSEDNYYPAVQAAFDFALANQKSVKLPNHYEIGDNTITLKKASNDRFLTQVFGGGSIRKSSPGAMFNGTNTSSSDFIFNGVGFEGVKDVDVIVFDTGEAKLIRIKTSQCHFKNIKDVFYSPTYLQDIMMNQDTIVFCHGSVVRCHGLYGFFADKITHEQSRGNFYTQTETSDISDLGDVTVSFKVENSIIEGFLGQGGIETIFDVRKGTVQLTNNYFEGIPKGVVSFSNTGKLIAENNIVYGSKNNDEYPFVKLSQFGNSSELYNNTVSLPLLDNTLIPLGGRYPIIDDNTHTGIIGSDLKVIDLDLNRKRLKRHATLMNTAPIEIPANKSTNFTFNNIKELGGISVELKEDGGFVIKENGMYLIIGNFRWSDASLSGHVTEIEFNQRVAVSGRNTVNDFQKIIRVTDETTQHIRVFHNNSEPLSIDGNGASRIQIVRIGDV